MSTNCPQCGYPLYVEQGSCRTCRQPVSRSGVKLIANDDPLKCPECGGVRIRYCGNLNAIVCMQCDTKWKHPRE